MDYTRYLFWFKFDVYNDWCQKMWTIPTKMYAFTRRSATTPHCLMEGAVVCADQNDCVRCVGSIQL